MIRVNADYETELFTGGPGPKAINEAIEFMAFFLVDEPILTNKNYAADYLKYVQSITGIHPKTASVGKARNWWGALENREEERRLNSKMTSTELAIKNKWVSDTFIIQAKNEIPSLKKGRWYLVKGPYEMSGRGFSIISKWNENLFKRDPLIVEPLLDRKIDFSLYYRNDGTEIFYENLVDSKFQYKGSIFNNRGVNLKDLTFYSKVEGSEWEKYLNAKEILISNFKSNLSPGFSADSFVYEEDGKLKIHILSEINARRTMGLTAYEIGEKLGENKNWWALILGKSLKAQGGFSYLHTQLEELKDSVIILSPGDTRFEMLFLMAKDEREGENLLQKIKSLLPEAEFPTLR